MPFIKYDRLDKDENIQEGEYEYRNNAFNSFQTVDLSTGSQEVFSILRSFGMTAIRGRYYGGNDEGFSNFFEAEFPTHTVTKNELIDLLSDTALGDKGSPQISNFTFTEEPPRQIVVLHRLEWFTDEMAICLLGKSFGVGDYLTIRGAFKVDLEQGFIIDEYEQGRLFVEHR